MFCEKCGSKIPDGSAFCPNCGAKAAAAAVKEAKKEAAKAAEVVTSEAAAVEQQAETVAQQVAAAPEAVPAQVEAAVDQAQAVGQEAVPVAAKPPKQKKEKSGKGISPVKIALIAVAAVVVVVAAIFLLSKSARNAVKKAFSSDESYFVSVEQAAVEDLADMLTTAYESDILELLDFYKSEFALSGDIDISKDAEDLLETLNKASGKKLDLTWLKTGKVEAAFAMKDKSVQLNGGITANKKTLFDFDFIVDFNDAYAYIGLPLLNSEYAAIDLSDKLGGDEILDKIDEIETYKDALPTTKEIKSLVSRYTKVALSKIKKVNNVKKDVKLKVGSASGEYTRYRVVIDEELMKDIYDAVLNEILKDDELDKMLVRMEDAGIFKKEGYVDAFYEEINNALDNLDNRHFDEISLEVYVDGAGDIVAQHIFDADAKLIEGYQYVIGDDNSFGFEIGEYRNDELRKGYSIDGTISGNKVTGTVNYLRSGSVRTSIDFIDVDVRKLLSGNPSGKLEYDLSKLIGSSSFRGFTVTVDFDLVVKNSKVNVVLKEDDKKLITADLSLKKSSASTIKAPSKTVDIENNNDIKDFLEDLDWDKMIENCEAADMPDMYTRALDKLSRNGLSLDSLMSMLPRSIRNMVR
ncbi:MAG: zinc ribbon domain-containing protein [Lachnospiraceae bacterium]|nr:zinc ribbon domain-containing protein [Lachnospiraceae bacterium]